ncbi:MAG TPA: NUDIX hydrolase [Usitatibacter sp.]|nr:NUDIX hydrolase [Usitatibacter sp.]
MKFCNSCGSAVTHRVPAGDSHTRAVCDACGAIQYENPKIVVGAVPVWGERILMCRRAIEPRYGLWTLPAGFMENGETAAEGAMREALEEARARIEIQELYTLYSVPHVNQVHMMFRARLLNEDYGAGAETLEVKLMSAEEIPWNELAFAVVRRTLEHFLADRELGTYTMRSGDILSPVR